MQPKKVQKIVQLSHIESFEDLFFEGWKEGASYRPIDIPHQLRLMNFEQVLGQLLSVRVVLKSLRIQGADEQMVVKYEPSHANDNIAHRLDNV